MKVVSPAWKPKLPAQRTEKPSFGTTVPGPPGAPRVVDRRLAAGDLGVPPRVGFEKYCAWNWFCGQSRRRRRGCTSPCTSPHVVRGRRGCASGARRRTSSRTCSVVPASVCGDVAVSDVVRAHDHRPRERGRLRGAVDVTLEARRRGARTRDRRSPGRAGPLALAVWPLESVAVSFSSRYDGYSWSGVLNEPLGDAVEGLDGWEWQFDGQWCTISDHESAAGREGSVLGVGRRAAEARWCPRPSTSARGAVGVAITGCGGAFVVPAVVQRGLRDRVAAALVVLDPHVVRPAARVRVAVYVVAEWSVHLSIRQAAVDPEADPVVRRDRERRRPGLEGEGPRPASGEVVVGTPPPGRRRPRCC